MWWTFLPPEDRATCATAGKHKLVNKVSKLYVGKSRMSEEIGGLYVGLGGGGDDRIGPRDRWPADRRGIASLRRPSYVETDTSNGQFASSRGTPDYGRLRNYDYLREL
jgi:hypothetical protein